MSDRHIFGCNRHSSKDEPMDWARSSARSFKNVHKASRELTETSLRHCHGTSRRNLHRDGGRPVRWVLSYNETLPNLYWNLKFGLGKIVSGFTFGGRLFETPPLAGFEDHGTFEDHDSTQHSATSNHLTRPCSPYTPGTW